MTKGHAGTLRVVIVLLMPIFLPFVSASGQGLLLDGDQFIVEGDQQVGSGDINVTAVVVSHDSSSSGNLEMVLTSESNTQLASDNRSISLLADESVTEVFDIQAVPIGTHVLVLRLWGDVGVEFENNLSEIQIYVHKYSPADAVVTQPQSWTLTPINSSNNQPSGNESIRDGDGIFAEIGLVNTGDVSWDGNLKILIDGIQQLQQPVTIFGDSTFYANVSLGPFTEGAAIITAILDENGTSISSVSTNLTIGPPPLPRVVFNLDSNPTAHELGNLVQWNISVENTGEIAFNGDVICNFPSAVEIINTTVSIPPQSIWNSSLQITVRPGTILCYAQFEQRMHDDSLTNSSHDYTMSAGHLMRAGSDGLTISGGPFHVGDPIPLAILIHNGGDFTGSASLEVRESNLDGSEMGQWATLEQRNLEVGSSLELGANHFPISSGEREIEWRIMSSDSLVSNDLSGSISVAVQPSQALSTAISSWSWTLSEGLEVEITTSLSNGESREVTLSVGTEGTSGEVEQISANILLSPGQRTLTYNLGQPTASSNVWARLIPVDWTSSTVAEDSTTIVRPEPRAVLSIDSVEPTNPVRGESATITYTLVNEGGGDVLTGQLTLIDNKDGEILWTQSSQAIPSGESTTASFSISEWPDYNVVDITMFWETPHTSAETTSSILSQSEAEGSDDLEIDWLAIVYGALFGLLIGLVTRTVMRARAGESILPIREQRTRAPASKKSKQVEEKVEVSCPACDQSLRVPATFSGTARCPACSQTFPVESLDSEEEEEEEGEGDDIGDYAEGNYGVEAEKAEDDEKESSSTDDIIRCPDCSQKLKVPYDRRPIRARCPACRCEFRALRS